VVPRSEVELLAQAVDLLSAVLADHLSKA
jgi:hypothetical protein